MQPHAAGAASGPWQWLPGHTAGLPSLPVAGSAAAATPACAPHVAAPCAAAAAELVVCAVSDQPSSSQRLAQTTLVADLIWPAGDVCGAVISSSMETHR